MIKRCSQVGFIDEPNEKVGDAVDGMPLNISTSIACLLLLERVQLYMDLKYKEETSMENTLF